MRSAYFDTSVFLAILNGEDAGNHMGVIPMMFLATTGSPLLLQRSERMGGLASGCK